MTASDSIAPLNVPKTHAIQRHIITSEYDPQPGGVSDYTRQVAEGLVEQGEEIHVWCPAVDPEAGPGAAGTVQVHRDLGHIMPQDLKTVGEQLDRFPAPRRILVQWVPHGYGRQSMNVPFCIWLHRRANKHGDIVELMVHEAFLDFKGSWRQYGAAFVHRLMTVILLRSCTRVWVSIPQCERLWKAYTFGCRVPFQWLPVPSNIRLEHNDSAARAVRSRYIAENRFLLGHFGTYGSPILSVLEPIARKVVQEVPDQSLLLMGRGSLEFRQHLIRQHPSWENNVHATGALSAEDLSYHISACDLLIQPYPDGATTRRTSLMLGLSHGTPIVTTQSEVTEPVWKESAAVGLVPAGDADTFVKLVSEILADPAECARLSQAARKLYRERFDISHTLAALRASAAESVPCAS